MFCRSSIILLVVIVFPVFFLTSCKSEGVIVEETPSSYDQKVEKFTATRVHRGKINMTLECESAVIDSKNIANLGHAVMKFYDGGNCVLNLISEGVRVNMETCDVECIGKCVINTTNNENLQTANLIYNAKNKLIYSNNDIKFTKPNETVYGTGFESDIMLSNIVIKNQRIIID
ncbi:MAG: LPS export ABC transporter periplasmic protein LptC [Endomicrobium sp.]|jgi:LPS export ABC transporter protein LptC|nr:LPS export ABC transporter periplasmic protein LptC [Endomicrobium sp.]